MSSDIEKDLERQLQMTHDRFVVAMTQTTGKRVTYKELTGKTMEQEEAPGSPLEPPPEPLWEPF